MIECIPYTVSKICKSCEEDLLFEEYSESNIGPGQTECKKCAGKRYRRRKMLDIWDFEKQKDHFKYSDLSLDFLSELSPSIRMKVAYYLQSTIVYG